MPIDYQRGTTSCLGECLGGFALVASSISLTDAHKLSFAGMVGANSFLEQVLVHDLSLGLQTDTPLWIAECNSVVLETRKPQLAQEGLSVCLGFPVFYGQSLQSIVNWVGSSADSAIGVVELWESRGPYRDLQLIAGHYGCLERFQNVSSFVRFEPGYGLPGQAAESGVAIVHDDLPNHPGFLRAAGASAGELQTAIGLPIFDPNFVAVTVLISSRTTPMARWIEVWVPQKQGFVMQQMAICGMLDEQHNLPAQEAEVSRVGLLGEVAAGHRAMVTCDTHQLCRERRELGFSVAESCLAVPTYRGEDLKSITLFWL
ncbi:MAG: GAF domain-containing protein [Planctomycetales bacterium]|nr:GAF domain-containing protein [Planctomycetales bacterium]